MSIGEGLTVIDGWRALHGAKANGWLNFQDDDVDIDSCIDMQEYLHYDRPFNGALHVIVPSRLLAFQSPARLDHSSSASPWRDCGGERHFGPAYYARLARCRAVVMAFHEPALAAGQLVYLQAVQYGKPVLASVSQCLDGYVIDGRTGLYFDKNAAGLAAALATAEGANWYAGAVAACLVDYPSRFGFSRLAAGYVRAIQPPANRHK
jgi:hypothetical protein